MFVIYKESTMTDPTNDNDTNANNNSTYGEVKTVGKSSNIAWHEKSITKKDYHTKNKHKSTILWFTGLSGSGKSTLANAVHATLFETPRHVQSYVLDGDNVRHGINQDLGFSDNDREENIRRVGHVAALFVDAGMVVLTAFVSPFRSDREKVRALVNKDDHNGNEFIEVYCNASLEKCEERDTKGLYAKARAGDIPHFTGISSPYEAPENPELNIDTGGKSLEECVNQVISYLEEKGIIPKV